uniref:Uncharacterized protein n=1 Tax=Zosterops lateralis melanops TaxID=1220523 RepID=A0A8D2P416_ZOSLA
MSLRRIFSRQSHTNPILCPTLPTSFRNRRPHISPPNPTARNRIKQPSRHPIRLRQNPIPPILLYQRHPRLRTYIHRTSLCSPIRSQLTRRPRKFHARQPPGNTTAH